MENSKKCRLCLSIDCIDYVTGIGNVIQAPPHSVLRANTFSVGQQATNSFDTSGYGVIANLVPPQIWSGGLNPLTIAHARI